MYTYKFNYALRVCTSVADRTLISPWLSGICSAISHSQGISKRDGFPPSGPQKGGHTKVRENFSWLFMRTIINNWPCQNISLDSRKRYNLRYTGLSTQQTIHYFIVVLLFITNFSTFTSISMSSILLFI